MHKSFLKGLLLVIVTALAVTFPTSSFAQIVSSGMTGTVRDTDGKALAGATVTAIHNPTNATYTAVTNQQGRYSFSGLPVGGPYTVTATTPGYAGEPVTDVTTQLGEVIGVDAYVKSDTVVLEKFVARGSSNSLDSTATGTGSVLTQNTINATSSVQRSFADVARTTPFVSLRGVLATRTQPVISAVGQNNRFNSVLVDGARINDQFGLNGSGLQAFGNPISLDTIEQFSVAVSPFDVRQSGFTGVAINAVTKSGTNEFHGSAYYYYTDQDFQNSNVFGTTTGLRPPLEQKTKGFTFGGPIIKNRLFFFVNYEKFNSTTSEIASFNPNGSPAGTTDFTNITTRLAAIKSALSYGSTLDFGTFPGLSAPIVQTNEIRLAKLDWKINADHRLSIRYNKTSGALPSNARYTLTNLSPLSGSGIANAPFATNLTSNFFSQVRKEEVWASQLFSQWTPDFKTEISYSQNEYSQATPTQINFPEVRIFGLSGLSTTGTALDGTSGKAGALVFGTEQNRHGNFVAVKTKSYNANAEYLWNNFTFSGGMDREESNFVNLFRNQSYGVFDYASVADFLNDTPKAFVRNYYVTGTPSADVSEFAVNGLFAQAKWQVNPRLNVILGVRYDWFTSGARPPLNTQLVNDSGGLIRNDGTVDGSNAVSPRLSFNYAVDESRNTQIRGGVGHFVGRIPWVLVSNSYGNSGVGRILGNPTINPTTNLVSYLQTQFDPKDPIGQISSGTASRATINLVSDKLNPPSVWRSTLALDRKLPFLDSVFSIEGIYTKSSEALFIKDLNIKPRFIGSDGRQVFSGPLATLGNANYANFSNIYAVSNVKEGSTTYVTVGINRPMKNRWSYSLNYTRGRAKDALLLGETTAGSQFGRNPVFNQNTPELSRSAFEVKDRVQLTISREFEFVKKWKTTASLYYEGRTGNPYSFVYGGVDLNGDTVNSNELIYVPTGTSDPVLANLSSTVRDQIMNYVSGSELAGYKGKIAPRNAFFMPWTNRLDLHIAQIIPIHKSIQFEVFADFVNFGSWISKKAFGYYETVTGTGDNELFAIKSFGAATYDPTSHQLLMTGTSFATPASAVPNNDLSRWRIQFGARLRF